MTGAATVGLPAVSRGRGPGMVAAEGKRVRGPHAGSELDRAGGTGGTGDGGREGDGVRRGLRVAYGAISRSG